MEVGGRRLVAHLFHRFEQDLLARREVELGQPLAVPAVEQQDFRVLWHAQNVREVVELLGRGFHTRVALERRVHEKPLHPEIGAHR